ncbi:nose resistant to fluoxetine protein 6-like isoform X2 [Choristoneura fumiferana]|uniref:nose resistant to fluoxetine protein 6-like isoform X2 n=1 Tax=Choristoneura fumiferana TaxID=7141 RepID=UPI003D15D0A9
MHSGLILTCFLSVSADNLFNYKLYKDVLDPEMCKLQVQSMSHEFYDASFRTPEGILDGNFASLGHYHQCLAINQDFPDSNIQGKYCLLRSHMTLPIIRIPTLAGVSVSEEKLTWTEMTLPPRLMKAYASQSLALAVCVPKTCTVDVMLAPYARNPVVNFNYSEEYCRLPNDRPFVAADYVAIFVFSLIALLTVFSTAYDLRHTLLLGKDPKQASELYRACSLYTNTRRLLAFKKPRPIDCLDGIRSLSILWIVLYHTYCTYFFYSNYVVNSLEAFEWSYKRHTMWIISDTVAVDSFFTLGGLLLAYSAANKMNRSSLLKNLHKFYMGRYIRLFPLLAAAVLLQASLIHRVSDGPNWHYMADRVELCRRYWWTALLHVQNIVNSFDMCLPQTWYLSVDMQLHIISPLVLYWVWGSRRIAYTALIVPIVGSLIVTLVICFRFNFITSRIALSANQQQIREHVLYYYQNTVTRSAPFFIGMLCGYVLHVYRGKKAKLPWWSLVTCYTLALVTLFYAIYIVHPSLQAGWKDHFSDNIHNSFRRVFWPLALCWLIFACIHGFGADTVRERRDVHGAGCFSGVCCD